MDSLELLWRPLLAGLAVVSATGVLGVFLLWRRMAYFGDALAHSALLGVALGIILGTSEHIFVLVIGCLIAFIMAWVQHNPRLGNDTMLGILGHGSLALGLVVLHFASGQSGQVEAYLFGDILLLQTQDVYLACLLSVVVSVVMWRCWQPLLLMTIHHDLAQAEGVNTRLYSLIYMILIALVVAVAMRVVGILLLTALLIIPAAAARNLSRTPEQMVLWSMGLGAVALCMGLQSSWWFDSPAGPSIVVVATLIFILAQLKRVES